MVPAGPPVQMRCPHTILLSSFYLPSSSLPLLFTSCWPFLLLGSLLLLPTTPLFSLFLLSSPLPTLSPASFFLLPLFSFFFFVLHWLLFMTWRFLGLNINALLKAHALFCLLNTHYNRILRNKHRLIDKQIDNISEQKPGRLVRALKFHETCNDPNFSTYLQTAL